MTTMTAAVQGMYCQTLLWITTVSVLVRADDTGKALVGLIDDKDLPLAGSVLFSCPHRDLVKLEALPSVTGYSSLDRAQKLKSRINNKSYFALIGQLTDHVTLVTDDLDIPVLAAYGSQTTAHSRNVYHILPKHSDVIDCIRAITNLYKWGDFGVLWDGQIASKAVADFLDASVFNVHMFRIQNETSVTQIREALRTIRQRGYTKTVILTKPAITDSILDMVAKIGIMALPYSWLIIHNGNWSAVEDSLVDVMTNVTLVQVLENWPPEAPTSRELTDRSLVNTYAITRGVQLVCDVMAEYNERDNLTLSIKKAHQKGVQLPMQFDDDGTRVGFSWNLYTHNTHNFFKFARWNRGIPNMYRSDIEMIPDLSDQPQMSWTEHVRVVTILERPWAMRREGTDDSCTGNHCYDGFIVDMMKAIASEFSPPLEYELYVVADGAFGSFNTDIGLWNGIMGEIISRNATMSLAPLSINKQREEAVDFTKPFKTRGISVLIKTPKSQSSFFQFLAPLSYKVWCAILIAMVAVSVALWLFEKHGISQRRDMIKISSRETCWFVFGSLVQEGTESTPVTIGGRILIGSWWFFAMILLSSYTANLAAFLTLKKINSPIESVSDLVGQTKMKYGTVRDSGVLAFFQNTQIEPYRTMWTRMSPDSLVDNTEEGLKRVQEGNYAFLWDDTVTSYIASIDCNFTEIGPSFDPKGYGIGVPSGAIYRENLTLAVLSLADKGTIDKLEDVSWNSGKCPSIKESIKQDDTEELHLENIAGIFFVLLGGLVLGFFACIVDKFIISVLTKKKGEQMNTHPHEMNRGTSGPPSGPVMTTF